MILETYETCCICYTCDLWWLKHHHSECHKATSLTADGVKILSLTPSNQLAPSMCWPSQKRAWLDEIFMNLSLICFHGETLPYLWKVPLRLVMETPPWSSNPFFHGIFLGAWVRIFHSSLSAVTFSSLMIPNSLPVFPPFTCNDTAIHRTFASSATAIIPSKDEDCSHSANRPYHVRLSTSGKSLVSKKVMEACTLHSLEGKWNKTPLLVYRTSDFCWSNLANIFHSNSNRYPKGNLGQGRLWEGPWAQDWIDHRLQNCQLLRNTDWSGAHNCSPKKEPKANGSKCQIRKTRHETPNLCLLGPSHPVPLNIATTWSCFSVKSLSFVVVSGEFPHDWW